jgi:hypothetical protein
MKIPLLKFKFHPVIYGKPQPYKFHNLPKSTYFSIKITEHYIEIEEPRFPGDDRERIEMTKLVDKYFKIESKELEADLKFALNNLKPIELIYKKSEDPNAFDLVDFRAF